MKNLLLCCLALFVVASVVGCSDTSSTTASSNTQSTALAPDSKDIKK